MSNIENSLHSIDKRLEGLERTLAERCKNKESRIEKLEKKTAWTYVFAALLVASDLAFKIFR